MKKFFLLPLAFLSLGSLVWGQTSVSQEVTAFGSYGLADTEQAIHRTTEAGTYDYQKNGTSLNTTLTFTSKVAYFYDIVVKLNAKSRVGSPYRDLQLAPASVQNLGLTVDSAYTRLNLLNVLGLADPFDLYLTAGKYAPQASNFQKQSPYGTESALNMLKLANTLNTGLELTYKLPVAEPVAGAPVPTLSLQTATALNFDEGAERLYDTDGLLGNHGTKVLGKYAAPIFSSIKLTNLDLGFATVAAEGIYSLNGGGTFSGNSFGASALVTGQLIPGVLTLPVGLGVASYEKNIDVLAGAVRSDTDALTVDIVDYRDTLRVGASTGLHYQVPDELGLDLNLAGSYTQIKHYQRDPLSLMGASVDGRVTLLGTYFVGAGVVLGTLADTTWKPSSGSPASKMVFLISENYGAEAFAGLNLGAKGSLVVGVNNNKGLALNYGLESLKDGEYKFLQKGSDNALYETCAVFLKASFRL